MLYEKTNNLSIDGLSKREGKLYLALLSAKKATVLQLAKISGMRRAAIYELLVELEKKGLVSEIYEEKKHYFLAESPEKLLNFLKEREREVRQLLPLLRSMENTASGKPKIKFYIGKQGIRDLYGEILQSKKEIVGFAYPDKLFETIESFPELVQKRVKLKIPIRLIMPDTRLARQRKATGTQELRTIKLFDALPFAIVFYIAGHKTAIFSLKQWFTGVLIEDRDISDGLKSFFEALWVRLE